MSRPLVLAVVSWLCLGAAASPVRAVDTAAQSAIDRCRLAFPDATANPSATGGWLTDKVGETQLLCLYGSVAVAPDAFHDALATPFDLVVARSTGGPVPTWLAAAERLLGHVETVVVDEACFSSCANYIVPLGREVVAVPNSLVVWHGGPTLAGVDESASGVTSLDELLSYFYLAERTEQLYAQLGINPAILRDSGHAEPGQAIAGYAFSPTTLARCYGFANVSGLWHAGDDTAVAALARKRSATLNLAESPKAGCDAAPAP